MQPNAAAATDSIVIYRSVNREGQAFALQPRSERKLREAFGDQLRVHSRVFVGHETSGVYEQLGENLASQVIMLLTGLSEQQLRERHFEVHFREPVEDTEVARVDDRLSVA